MSKINCLTFIKGKNNEIINFNLIASSNVIKKNEQ